eukprot:TRINITY_DN47336_c0_g1_i1.p2 TRINITY_DN47336_c0_g1~~TRINITY_DN47336_c0_g1_i1.p2  ORF type:complete len:102 (+),score=20.56 TRINITY_DN47336_c0_g1_i1:59-364(+)
MVSRSAWGAVMWLCVVVGVHAQPSDKARQHAPRVKQNFAESDTDGNGILNLAELTAARQKMGSKDAESHAKRTISKMDKDGDGHVSLREFFVFNHIPEDEL